MKQKEILLIIPYFGKLPNWFPLFLKSASKTDLIHFLLITDDENEQIFPENFTIVYQTFKEVKTKFHEKLGADIYLEIPYKLCDYKPTYGFVFNEFVTDYKFWGYCDIDLIFGDIDRYLREINYSSYDRLFPHGHLTIYRNTAEINVLFKTKNVDKIPSVFNFEFATGTTYPCHFDEIGMNFIVENSSLKYFRNSFSRNTHYLSKNLTTAGPTGKYPEIIYYQDRSVIVSNLVEGKIVDEEIMYIHLISKKDLKILLPIENDFIMFVKGFLPLEKHDKFR